MATKKKMLQAAAGNAGGAGGVLNVEDVFSTYLYDGTNVAQTITNGIDLAGEGGLVWQKLRTHPTPPDGQDHYLRDTERGVGKRLRSNSTAAEVNDGGITSVNSDGFSLSSGTAGNLNGATYASWTFRKAPKFFDVVTYTGDGVAGREIAHNLGTTVGAIFIKRTDTTSGWRVFHRTQGGTKYAMLQATNAFAAASTVWNNTDPTDSVFTVGTDTDTNVSGGSFVAYIFAHNNGDGEFGPDGDADIIKCGSYTGNGASPAGPIVDLGFEPQWLLIKNTSASANWYIYDTMRGWPVDSSVTTLLRPDTTDAELGGTWAANNITPTGFQIRDNDAHFNTNGSTYIYIAIRRGTKVPESATEVFDVEFGSASPKPWFKSGFPVDFGVFKNRDATGNWQSGSRLTQGTSLNPNKTQAEEISASAKFDYQNGWYNSSGASTSWLSWMWKRAPGFFDVVAYSGDGVAGRTVSHNLTVAPEMMWVKRRDGTGNWIVYTEPTGNTDFGRLNQSNEFVASSVPWNNTSPTSSVFTVGGSAVDFSVNNSGADYIAYLFSSLDGISKVGSYTGNGTSQTINCGFTSGARFVLIKNTDTDGLVAGWALFDTERGIVSGNDSLLYLNTTGAENTSYDIIDPHSSGFIVNQEGRNLNYSGEGYIFYAIA